MWIKDVVGSFLFVVGYKLGEVLWNRGGLEERKIHICDGDEISEEIGGGVYIVGKEWEIYNILGI